MRPAAKPLMVTAAALLGAVATIALYNPGVMSADSLAQYREAITGNFEDWHPPLMAFTWSLLMKVVPGPIGLLAFHQVLFWGGLALIAISLRLRPLASAALILAIGFFPTVFALLGTLWKDVGLGAALTLAVGLILLGKRRGSLALLVAAFLPLMYAFGVRYNALAAVIPLVAWCTYEMLRLRGITSKRIVAVVSAALVVAILVVQLSLASAILPQGPTWKSTAALQASLIHDLEGIAASTGQLRFPDYALATGVLTIDLVRDTYQADTLALVYDPRLRDTIISHDGGDLPALEQTWWGAVSSSPLAYVQHRLAVLATLFGVTEVYYPFQEGISPNDLGLQFNRSPVYNFVVRQLHRTQTIFFRGWIYLLVAVALVVTGMRQRKWRSTWIAISGIAYVLPYAFISTGSDFRYIWWLVLATLIALAVRLDEVRNPEEPVRAEAGADTRI